MKLCGKVAQSRDEGIDVSVAGWLVSRQEEEQPETVTQNLSNNCVQKVLFLFFANPLMLQTHQLQYCTREHIV